MQVFYTVDVMFILMHEYHAIIFAILGKSTLFNRLMCKESNRAYRLGSEKKKTNTRSQAS